MVVKIVVVVSAYNEKETHKILSQNTAVHLTGDEDEMSELVQQSQLYAAAAGKVVVEWSDVAMTTQILAERLNDALW